MELLTGAPFWLLAAAGLVAFIMLSARFGKTVGMLAGLVFAALAVYVKGREHKAADVRDDNRAKELENAEDQIRANDAADRVRNDPGSLRDHDKFERR